MAAAAAVEKVSGNEVDDAKALVGASGVLWSNVLAMEEVTKHLLNAKDEKGGFVAAMMISSFCIHFGHFYRLLFAGKQPVRNAYPHALAPPWHERNVWL